MSQRDQMGLLHFTRVPSILSIDLLISFHFIENSEKKNIYISGNLGAWLGKPQKNKSSFFSGPGEV